MNKRTKITMEREELAIIARPGRPKLAWCDQCSDVVRMLTPDEATAVVGQSSRQIYRWVEAGSVHFLETREGFLSICLRSLY